METGPARIGMGVKVLLETFLRGMETFLEEAVWFYRLLTLKPSLEGWKPASHFCNA